jgi:hypothetical protein
MQVPLRPVTGVLDPPMRAIGTVFDGKVWLQDQYRDIVNWYCCHPGGELPQPTIVSAAILI